MKAFTLFTKDVPGEMCVVPAGGQERKNPTGGQGRKSPAVARLERVCRDAVIGAKLDRIVELMGRITAEVNRPVPDLPGAGPGPWDMACSAPGPSASALAQQWRGGYEQRCAEAEAAYAARNPHKKGGGNG